MSLAWFGVVSRPSGQTSTVMKRWSRSGVWPLLLALQLIGCLSSALLWNSTPRSTGPLRKQRGRSTRRQPVKRESWSQRGLAIQVVHRAEMGPVISATYGNSSGSFYAVSELKDWLLSLGMEPDEPVMEWLWACEGGDG